MARPPATVHAVSEPRSSARQSRRRAETRAKLIDSARRLFAQQGLDRTAISEITEGADVGFGSFYNHFDSKEAIATAVLTEDLAAHAAKVARLTARLEDPAEVIAAAHRYFVRLARHQPDWAWPLVRLDVSEIMRAAVWQAASEDLQRGIAAGRLDVADVRTALMACGGALLGVMRAVLEDLLPDDAEEHHAELMLRMLGVPAAEAAAIARRPLPFDA